jgi:hypothetical protein
MMDNLEAVLGPQTGGALEQLARQFSLKVEQVKAAVASFVPALAAGFQKNIANPAGLDGLTTALASGKHERYVEDTTTLERPETVEDGNGILSHVFGSKDVSRHVADRAAAESGVGQSVLKKMLPLVAALVMGAMARRTRAAPGVPADRARNSGLFDMLGKIFRR